MTDTERKLDLARRILRRGLGLGAFALAALSGWREARTAAAVPA